MWSFFFGEFQNEVPEWIVNPLFLNPLRYYYEQ